MPQKQEFLEIDEAMQQLGVSRKTIYNLINKGVLRRFKKPGQLKAFIPSEDIEKAKRYEEQ